MTPESTDAGGEDGGARPRRDPASGPAGQPLGFGPLPPKRPAPSPARHQDPRRHGRTGASASPRSNQQQKGTTVEEETVVTDVGGKLPRAGSEVVFSRIDGGGVLLSTEEEVYYGLNEVGAEVWELLDGEETRDALCSRLADRYPDADPTSLREDVAELLERLAELGLVVQGGEPRGAPAGPEDAPAGPE